MTVRSAPHPMKQFYFMAALAVSLLFIMITVASSDIDTDDIAKYDSLDSKITVALKKLKKLEIGVDTAKIRVLMDTIDKNIKEIKRLPDTTKYFESTDFTKYLKSRADEISPYKNALKNTVELSKEHTTIKGSKKPGTEKTYSNPLISFPWKLENWPANASGMSPGVLLKRIEELEQLPSDWADVRAKLFKQMKPRDMEHHLSFHIIELHERIDGRPWMQILAAQKRVGALYPGELLVQDVNKFSRGWSKGSFKDEMLASVFGVRIFKRKITDFDWNWTNSVGKIETIQLKYEQAQENLRNVLLQVDDKWDTQTKEKWNSKRDQYSKEIINSERKMIWLLGASDKNVGKWLDNAVNFKNDKKTGLAAAHNDLLGAFRDNYWFSKTNAFAKAAPKSIHPADSIEGKNEAKDLKNLQSNAEKYKSTYDKLELHMKDLGDDMDKMGGKKKIYTEGLKRAIKLKLFKPHLIYNKDFYKSILGENEFENMKEPILFLSDITVIKQFLNSDEFIEYKNQKVIRGFVDLKK